VKPEAESLGRSSMHAGDFIDQNPDITEKITESVIQL
jgi:hypothetical protein